MSRKDYWFFTLFFALILVAGVLVVLRVPGEEGLENYLDEEATASAMLVSQVQPIKGGIAGGDEVVITGENFPEGVEVAFGDKLAVEVQREDGGESLVATTPATEAAGVVPIWLLGPEGESLETEVSFFYLNQ